MMKYVLLAYRDEERWESMSVVERAALEEACQASEQDLIRSLHLIDVQGLQNNTALTVRIVDGNVSLTDGPVQGGQEQLIQLLIIQARDLNTAIQIASQMPQARGVPIEVRPIAEGRR
ncbi:MAG: YciI family protein [Anaerolineales bacterium]